MPTPRDLIRLIRPHHWIKNLLAFAPLFFSFSFDSHSLLLALGAFASFSLAASGVYVVNDIKDRDRDRHHPEKKHRPIAAGRVGPAAAAPLGVTLLAAGSLLAWVTRPALLLVVGGYVLLNLIYSLGLKQLPLIDVMVIALGFLLRVAGGAVAIAVSLSHWILLCTFFVALFLGFCKRKHEVHALRGKLFRHRKSASEYTEQFIDQLIVMTAGISLVFYALYAIDPATIHRFGSDGLVYTIPIVTFGIFRYFYLVYNHREGGDPVSLIVTDRQVLSAIALWLAVVLTTHAVLS